MTTLYHVVANGPDGTPHDYDLFVRADSPNEAVNFWRTYYALDDDEQQPEMVDAIPVGPKGAIKWEDVPCVWWPS